MKSEMRPVSGAYIYSVSEATPQGEREFLCDSEVEGTLAPNCDRKPFLIILDNSLAACSWSST